jgi:hypothetical protein
MRTHEAERQFYLAMFGVQLWYAREPLLGAAPSPEFVFPVERALTTSATDACRQPCYARSRAFFGPLA